MPLPSIHQLVEARKEKGASQEKWDEFLSPLSLGPSFFSWKLFFWNLKRQISVLPVFFPSDLLSEKIF
jgi:hypothetical protein